MIIDNLQTNCLTDPVGYRLAPLTLSWCVGETQGKRALVTRIWIAGDSRFRAEDILHDSKELEAYTDSRYSVPISLSPRTRYYWRVYIEADNGETAESSTAFFETGKLTEKWEAEFIGTKEEKNKNSMPYLYKDFTVEKPVRQARLYICGLGLYECSMNGEKLGEEYLLPGYHSYDLCLQYQTFVLEDSLRQGANRLGILLGDGWYKGRFVFEGGYENLYGNNRKVIAQLHILYEDGSECTFGTDSSFMAKESMVLHNSIYDGETADATGEPAPLSVRVWENDADKAKLTERLNPPIRITERLKPVKLILTPAGEQVLDFGQMVTGWVEFTCREKRGEQVRLYYGEVLQDGNFYRDNLRTAKAEYTFTSDGSQRTVRPHFTYYGFRYVKVEGAAAVREQDYTACRLMSDIRQTGSIHTSNDLVNRLFDNIIRSQKCNFLDIPTDCPQRDERMGWTGDTAVFAGTACLNMDCGAFYRHYLFNLGLEQDRLGGAVPFFVPMPKPPRHEGMNPFLYTQGACTWGDVATLLPWALYERYGEETILRENYPIMKKWVDYIGTRTAVSGQTYLWTTDDQLGDWLALDNGNPDNPIGKTDTGFIATAYYYYSARLCAEAAKVIKRESDAEYYAALSEQIKTAFREAYMEKGGRLTIAETQTAYSIVLVFGLCREEEQGEAARRLKHLMDENGGRLNTGFVGTPLLCRALSENGYSEMAYSLLLNEEYPGWLYEVNLGATTVWERWNSIHPDGHISGTEMNSLNHYAYGSIADWMYRYMCGFRPLAQGEWDALIRPLPDSRMKRCSMTAAGRKGKYAISWEWTEKGDYRMELKVPFNAKARVILPDGREATADAGIHKYRVIGQAISGNRV